MRILLMRSLLLRRSLTAVAAIAVVTACWPGQALAAPGAAGSGQATAAMKVVSFRGYRFEVPRSWPVIRTARHPGMCVRFDVHAVYLGIPGTNQSCPSWLVGTTEAILVEPGARGSGRRSTENPVANQIVATAPRIKVTGTFDTNPTVIYRILASAGLASPVIAAANPARLAAAISGQPGPAGKAGRAASAGSGAAGASNGAPAQADAVSASQEPAIRFGAAAPVLPATVADDIGLGFDVCAAPSASYMRAWWRDSRYRAVGVYIGGADRACDQQNLTQRWVRQEATAGWRFIPMYVGPQASFGQLSDPSRQGVAAAADAVQQAQRLGFGPQTPIYYDMEAYGSSDSRVAMSFLSSWTSELHALGYLSGVYSSSSSGISDLAGDYRSGRVTMPDVVYDALWNGAKNVRDSVYERGEWTGGRRLHQFSGNVLQTYGGDTMDVDQDYVDMALTAPGGTTQAAPGAVEADSSSAVFYEGKDHKLWEEARTASGSWSATDLGGSLSSQPSVVKIGRSGLAVLYRGASGELTVRRRTGGRWQSPQALPAMGVIGGAPRAVAQTNGVIDVFWSGNYDKHLWHGQYNPGQGWSGPQLLQGSLASWPYPVESGTGVVQVFWEGTDGRLYRVVRPVGAAWTAPQDLGMGPMGGAPHAVELANGETDVFWRGKIPHSVWSAEIAPDQRVSGPRNLGGQTTGAPWPVLAAGAETVLFRGLRGQLWQISRVRGRWGTAERAGSAGNLRSPPFAASAGAGSPVQVFWTGPGTELWSTRSAGSSWQQPVDLGGQVLGQVQ
jgi:Domain of unknown function (DUF1906)